MEGIASIAYFRAGKLQALIDKIKLVMVGLFERCPGEVICLNILVGLRI